MLQIVKAAGCLLQSCGSWLLNSILHLYGWIRSRFTADASSTTWLTIQTPARAILSHKKNKERKMTTTATNLLQYYFSPPFFRLCYCGFREAYLSAWFDASGAHASALVHFAQVHSFLIVDRPVDLSVFDVSAYTSIKKNGLKIV